MWRSRRGEASIVYANARHCKRYSDLLVLGWGQSRYIRNIRGTGLELRLLLGGSFTNHIYPSFALRPTIKKGSLSFLSFFRFFFLSFEITFFLISSLHYG
ncbi:hypothetical protein QYF36_012587 [Acer negundo]|nr:hypothetical protein QYF36_012587 [Acer negundo]